MKFGFHISIAGGLSKVPGRAEAKHCRTIQLFSRNPRGWRYRSLDQNEAESLREGLKDRKISPVFVHMPYLANLASPDPGMRKLSVASLVEELRRAPVLGAEYVVIHLGKRLGSSEESGLARVAQGINTALSRVRNGAGLLLEMTSGMGSEVGFSFSQVRQIIDGVKEKKRVGLCLDTAHVFQAGYDISTKSGLETTIDELEREVGLGRLRLIHLNDSKTPLGSRVDRHWHIGKGHIGMDGMRGFINHPALRGLPAIMETPRRGDQDDLANLRVVERLSR